MTLLGGEWTWWALGIALGAPVLLVTLTEVMAVLARRGSPMAGPIRLLRNWVIPIAALFVLLVFAFQSPADQAWLRVVATVFGCLVILLVLSTFNAAVFSGRGQRGSDSASWRDRVPTIFIEIARLILVVIGIAMLFKWVWGANVGAVFTALGVGSVILGLALQNAVGGVVSGLLLLFEQPFKLGDYLTVGTVSGRVVEVNWRSMHLDTGSGVQVVPNSALAAAQFRNKSRPDGGPFYASLTVRFAAADPPQRVLDLLLDVADSLPMLARGVRPEVYLPARPAGEFPRTGTEYAVLLPLPNPAAEFEAISTFLNWVWYGARRRGLGLGEEYEDRGAAAAGLRDAVDLVTPVLHLDEASRTLLTGAASVASYGAGELVIEPGVVPEAICFVVSGSARLAAQVGGEQVEVSRVERGDYIGESALTWEAAPIAVIADTVLTVLRAPVPVIEEIIRSRPIVAGDLSDSIDRRRDAARQFGTG